MMAGRPLRFLVAAMGAWIGARTVILWPAAGPIPALIHAVVPAARAEADGALPSVVSPVPPRAVLIIPVPPAVTLKSPPITPVISAVADVKRVSAPEQTSGPPAMLPAPGVVAGLPQPVPVASAGPSRWSGSLWLLARGGSGALSSGVLGGQLGGSQAGVRLAYLLDRRHRVAIAGRLTSPLGSGQREAAIGAEWQPTRLPVRLVADQRIALNGGRGGPELAVVGGAGPVPIGEGFRIDGYGQAGVIKRDVAEGYVDGAVHVAHPLGALGDVHFDLGGGVWGAAQRGARRLDLGPSLGAVVPLGKQRVRLSLDWRERIAGDARPGSGLAFTLGADF